MPAPSDSTPAPRPEPSIEDIARDVRPVAEAHAEVIGLYLFGSWATGDARPDSDVDLGVLFETRQDLGQVVRLETELERALGRKVDLVDMGRAKPFLALAIVEGERIYERDGYRCDTFDLYVLRRAGDLAYFERERRRLVLEEGLR